MPSTIIPSAIVVSYEADGSAVIWETATTDSDGDLLARIIKARDGRWVIEGQEWNYDRGADESYRVCYTTRKAAIAAALAQGGR